MGVLAQHVPSIEQLRPGLVEVIEESGGSKQFFRRPSAALWVSWTFAEHYFVVSGGFAVVQPGSKLSINAVEGYSLDSFNAEVCLCRVSHARPACFERRETDNLVFSLSRIK